MKDRVHKFSWCVITIVLTVVILQYLGLLLDPAWSQDGLDAVKAFHHIDKNSIDIIVYGSSHAWKGCDAIALGEACGMEAYNYACNWQTINTTQLFLEDSLRTQSPKVVCIEAYHVNEVLEDVDLEGQIYYTRPIPWFEGKKEYLDQCFGSEIGRYITYYLPIAMFHDEWINIDNENFRFPGYKRYINTKGAQFSDHIEPFDIPDYRDFPEKELEEASIESLNKMVELCKSKGIRVVFFTIPYSWEFCYSDAVKTFAEDNGCLYVDCFEHIEEIGLNGETDFADSGHLNATGAAKIGKFMGKYIKENIDF